MTERDSDNTEREGDTKREQSERERDTERGRKEETERPSGSNLLLAFKNTLMTWTMCIQHVCVFVCAPIFHQNNEMPIV